MTNEKISLKHERHLKKGLSMTSLNSINYNNSAEYHKPQISASTKRKLESLGIDPNLVTSEAQALSLIAARHAEKSFEQYAVVQEPAQQTEQTNSSSESSLVSEARSLAEQLGISISSDDSFEDITAQIGSAIQNLFERSVNDPQALQRAQAYKAQLASLTTQFSDISNTNSSLYSAMSLQAYNTRYMLGL